MLLSAEGISIRFGGNRVLSDINLQVAAGEIVGVIGPNGAGKTTLFHIFTGVLKPETGSVKLDGKQVLGRTPNAIARMGLGRTFQITRPFPTLSVRDNVMVGALQRYPSMAVARQRSDEVLERVQLAALADRIASTLTIGDRKKLELGRALATDPRLLLLDEVMGGLRPGEVEEFTELIRRLRSEGITVLMIEHIMSAIMRLSDRIVVLHQGSVLREGAPAEVARDPAVLEAYLGKGYAAHA